MKDYEYDYNEQDYDEDGPPRRRKVTGYDPNRPFLTQCLGGYLPVPKQFMALLIPEDAVTLAFLCDRHQFHKDRKELRDGKWFYCTVNTMKKALSLKKDRQAEILRRLEEEAEFIKRDYLPSVNGKGRNVRWIQIRHKEIARVVSMMQERGTTFTKASSVLFYEKARKIRVKNVDECKFKPKEHGLRGLRRSDDSAVKSRRRKRTA